MIEIKKQFNILKMSIEDIREINPKPLIKTMLLKGNLDGRRSNQLLNEFNKIGLHFNYSDKRTTCELKFIPDIYKYSSIKDRLDLLAGLIDSDGYLHETKSYFEIILKSKQLIDDIIFVAKSLGFRANYKLKYDKRYNKYYHRCNILGDVAKIPTRLNRKKSDFVRVGKDPSRCGFTIEPIGKDDFYGFELDGDHLYMTDDFLINHNSGKSLVIYNILRRILTEDKSVLIITPQVDLVNQLFNDFKYYGWKDCQNFVNCLHGEVKKYVHNKPVLISTYQSLLRLPKALFETFDAVIVDEVHTAKAVSIRDILIQCINAEYRIGLTATLPKKELDKFTIFSYLGRLIFDIPIKILQDEGFLIPLIVNFIILQYPDSMRGNCKLEFDQEYKIISKIPKRNNLLTNIINRVNPTENILILCKNLNQVKDVYKFLQLTAKNYSVYRIQGEVESEERDKIIAIMESQESIIIVATYGTMSTGRNVKRLHHVVMFSPYKSDIKVIQSIGRGTRLHVTKSILNIWDIVDDLRYYEYEGSVRNKKLVLKDNYLIEHSKLRLEYYKELEFPVKLETIEFESL